MINFFRLVSLLEGISYILLLFIAVPIKYLQGNPEYVKMLGMPHGLLFVGYIVLAIMLKYELNWNGKTFGIVCLLSILPFGTFFVGKYLKKVEA
ncbi:MULTISPECIES: DUF3817 domain-containing protein [Tenacibaculum]|uniref:DUF3817 domain-containing protein n=1 Tax=Tenacibaculum mesophilum TaxID=104268 RepID=A0ABN5TB54_9FLAO|nr:MULTISPECIES: DUF3817 domain-containing protein [Tenacibaculum]AZJ33176.1 DUF3817 domain-containing protein [Tenacibaculum mesophilum]KAF9659415.1 DUF3817 domain-containing protein [Tenacibaculum mesophilum]MCO7184380.1 DUF3817 domain-containing protein [Tenacibaculum sp. XPcli2-G]QFS28424.1 DUF3817 domain-containing protein [Tenacibaculum mesophilum]SHF65995.1 integral membrane protein [Tenacibaculum mesophilum]